MTLATELKIAEYSAKTLRWLTSRFSGRVTIVRPEPKKAISTEWVRVEGTHHRVATGKYKYWMMTTTGNEWWPTEDITLQVNGTWASRINVGKDKNGKVFPV
jgi:hypothetical protein